MRKQILILSMVSLVVLALSGCKKEEVTVSDTPEISLVSVSPGTVKELTDSLVFVLHYKDGDGDLGENNPDAINLYVQDNRISEVEGFRIPQLAPTSADITIEGDLNVVLPSTGITNGSSSQAVTFTLWLRDRAGNESNRVTSGEVTVVK